MANKYPKKEYKKVGLKKIGKKITIPGQAMSVKNLFENHVKGWPLPMEQQEVQLPDDINEILEDRFDLPNPERYASLDLIEKRQVMANIQNLQSSLNDKIAATKKAMENAAKEQQKDQIIADYEAKKAEAETKEST